MYVVEAKCAWEASLFLGGWRRDYSHIEESEIHQDPSADDMSSVPLTDYLQSGHILDNMEENFPV